MNCKVCNSPITEGQSFCSYCGTKIEAPAEETVAVAEEIPAQETKTEEAVTETISETPPSEETDKTEQVPEAQEEPVTAETEAAEEPAALAEPPTQPPAGNDDALDKDATTGFILGILAYVISCAGIPLGIIGLIKATRGMKAPNKRVFGIIGTILSAAGIVGFFTSIFSFISAFQSGMDLYEMLDLFVSNIPW